MQTGQAGYRVTLQESFNVALTIDVNHEFGIEISPYTKFSEAQHTHIFFKLHEPSFPARPV